MGRESDKEMGQTSFYISDWLVDPAASRIRKNDQEVKLEPKVMEVLCYMAKRPGMVITREHLESDVWTGTIVGYDALTATIIKLRKALQDNSKNPKYIETLPKKGYRLIADVQQTDGTVAKSSTITATEKQSSINIRIIIPVALVIISILSWLIISNQIPEPEVILADKPSIVVLPFANISKETEQNYFANGITEDLTTDLSGLSGLYVIARRSANIYKGKTIDAIKVSKELDVKYIVEGSVQKSGDHIRVNVRLIDAKNDHQIWAERYDRELKDIFTVQDELRKNILFALEITLTAEEQKRIAHRYTASLEAYDIFLQAQSYLVHQTKDDNKIARKLFLDAIEIDPGFARAYGGLALSHANDFRFHWTADQTQSAKEALKTGKIAISLDALSPQAHWVLGYIYLFVKEDHGRAIKMGLRTIEIEPNHADGLMLLAVTYVFAGEPKKAIKLVSKAKRLNPYYPSQYPSVLGTSNLLAGNYEASIKAYEESIEINSSRIQPNIYLAASYFRAGQLDAAIWQVEQIKLNFPFFKLDEWVSRQPYRDPEVLTGIVRDLNKAGLS